ncbi:hypothetical protein PC112_g22751 [Phytophthora cactorum]|nr:hypothetical protein PC112_g22751 [Phytophthora cactorum]
MVPTSSQICIILFTPVEDNMFTCTTCAKTYKKGNGYTNLLTHPRRTHIDYEQDAQEAAPKPAEPTSHVAAFEAATKELQKSSLTMSAVCRLVDQVIKLYPFLKARLVVTARIVNYPDLELGLVKLQRGEHLNLAENAVCAEFRAPSLTRVPGSGTEEASMSGLYSRGARWQSARCWLHPTDVERVRALFFTAAKLVLTDLRKSMSPRKLGMVMSLQYNKDMWDMHTVDENVSLSDVLDALKKRKHLFGLVRQQKHSGKQVLPDESISPLPDSETTCLH